jgi:hypothetical protein
MSFYVYAAQILNSLMMRLCVRHDNNLKGVRQAHCGSIYEEPDLKNPETPFNDVCDGSVIFQGRRLQLLQKNRQPVPSGR